MTAARVHFDGLTADPCYQGRSFHARVEFTDPAGDPIDLTGFTGRMVIGNGQQAMLTLTTGAGLTHGDGFVLIDATDEQTATLTVPPAAQLSDIPSRTLLYTYDLEAGGDVTPFMHGRFLVIGRAAP